MTKIKICGMRRAEDISYVNEFMPDYAGFIYAFGRKRTISLSEGLELKNKLDPKIKAVGVFLDQPMDYILQAVDMQVCDIIQLHGIESDEYIREVKAKSGLPVIKAFRVETKSDIEKAVASAADYIMLDNGIGGTGEKFDWSLISGIERPFFLAGGLSSENIAEVMKDIKPFAVDVSSGVETEGVKDRVKIERFISSVRAE